MNTFNDLLRFASLTLQGIPIRGEVIGTDTLYSNSKEYEVDTCFVRDACQYETAIRVSGKRRTPVERYDTPEAAQGHEYWINFLLEST